MKVQAIFSRNRTVFSLGIRIFSSRYGILPKLSEYSHCALILPDNTIIESTFKTGVHHCTFENFMTRATKVEVVTYDIPDANTCYTYAMQQLGKPYDKTAVIGMPLNRDWQQDTDWFCSELLLACLVKGGKVLTKSYHNMTPEDAYVLRD